MSRVTPEESTTERLGSPYAFFDGEQGFEYDRVLAAVNEVAASLERTNGDTHRWGRATEEIVPLAVVDGMNRVETVVTVVCANLERSAGCRGLRGNSSAVSVVTQMARRRLTC